MKTENNENLATEILREFKKQSRRFFIMLIVVTILLLVSNGIWLYEWNLHKNTNKSLDFSNQTRSNVVYNGEGEVKINGEIFDK